MAELTIHTGFAGNEYLVHVDWFDHNNVRHQDHIRIAMEPEDKPRTLTVTINDKVVWMNTAGKQGYC